MNYYLHDAKTRIIRTGLILICAAGAATIWQNFLRKVEVEGNEYYERAIVYEKPLKLKGSGQTIKLIGFHDFDWDGSDYLFLDCGNGPLYISSLSDGDENFAEVLLSKDEAALIVRSRDKKDYKGGYIFSSGKVMNEAESYSYAINHAISKGNVFFPDRHREGKRLKVNEVEKYNRS